MIRRYDAPLSTHVDYRVSPAEWLIVFGTLLAVGFVMIAAMGLTS